MQPQDFNAFADPLFASLLLVPALARLSNWVGDDQRIPDVVCSAAVPLLSISHDVFFQLDSLYG